MQIKEQAIFNTTDELEIYESKVSIYHCFFTAKNLEAINNG